jgi:hypothetical protein
MENLYWFSFSHKGKNVGVCVVSEETEEKAKAKAKLLGIYPENDDVASFTIEELESEMVENVLYTTEQMIAKDYGVHCSIKLSEN